VEEGVLGKDRADNFRRNAKEVVAKALAAEIFFHQPGGST